VNDDRVWMSHPDIDGEPVSMTREQYDLHYEARGWQLVEAPLDYGTTPITPPPPPEGIDEMTKAELVDAAKQRGVPLESGAKKDEIADALKAAATTTPPDQGKEA
jgi:hypothetical protein